MINNEAGFVGILCIAVERSVIFALIDGIFHAPPPPQNKQTCQSSYVKGGKFTEDLMLDLILGALGNTKNLSW